MLGTTVPDAILIGGLIASVLAGLFGKKEGDKAKLVVPPDPVTSGVAAGFVDKDLMLRLVLAAEGIAQTVKAGYEAEAEDKRVHVVEKLDALERAIREDRREDLRDETTQRRDDAAGVPRRRQR